MDCQSEECQGALAALAAARNAVIAAFDVRQSRRRMADIGSLGDVSHAVFAWGDDDSWTALSGAARPLWSAKEGQKYLDQGTVAYCAHPQHSTIPAVVMPQEWAFPAAIWVKETPTGGTVLPSVSSPQHSTKPVTERIPHVWKLPAATASKSPGGGDACPNTSESQHSTGPAWVTPHPWLAPSEIDAIGVAGGEDVPAQHSIVP